MYSWLADFDHQTINALIKNDEKLFRSELADVWLNQLSTLANNYPDQSLLLEVNQMQGWPQAIEQAYQVWIKSPNGFASLKNWTDEFRFFKFVWSCLDQLNEAPSHVALEKRLSQEGKDKPVVNSIDEIVKLFRKLQQFASSR
jgi:hypothetical protein